MVEEEYIAHAFDDTNNHTFWLIFIIKRRIDFFLYFAEQYNEINFSFDE